MSNPGSITRLLDQLRSGDTEIRDEAARQIWEHYFGRLLGLACKHLEPRVRQREDGEDVLQSMYLSFCTRQQRGHFDLDNRHDLWRLLVTMTLRKTRNTVQKHRRDRRDHRREEATPSPRGNDSLPPEGVLERWEGTEPTPAEAALLAEEVERRLRSLSEPLRQIALWKLQGYTNEEIASEALLNCSERTVERKLNLIREAWDKNP